MENLELNTNFWKNRDVFITGHTGFKGGWLTLILSSFGAKVHGYSLEPNTKDNFYELTKLTNEIQTSIIGDVRNFDNLKYHFNKIKPSVVFHLAAQPLVNYSYKDPHQTFSTNLMGTVNILEAARLTESVEVVLNITTDKCYKNLEDPNHEYSEFDELGGNDPYSGSKASSELITHAYRESFFNKSLTSVATARGGNVIGGGDWSEDRLVPDLLRTLITDTPIKIRNPNSTRPWQHVLDALSGYVKLAEQMSMQPRNFSGAWNFGPDAHNIKPVLWIAKYLRESNSKIRWEIDDDHHNYEAKYLRLDSAKAKLKLDWKPTWEIETALDKTLEWHAAWLNGSNMKNFTLSQINEFYGS